MANPRALGHRIRAGTWSSTSVTTAYQIMADYTQGISGFPIQTDQVQDNVTQIEWVAPTKVTIPEYARVANYADGSARPDGFLTVSWTFAYWTLGMMNYFLSTYLASSVYSAPVTIMTYDVTDTPVFIQCTLLRPVRDKDFEWAIAGYSNISLHFVYGVVTS